MPTEEAPFLRFQKSYEVDSTTGCWNWTGGTMGGRYGHLKCWGKWKGAHQLSHELYHGPIPDGMQVLHSCDNKRCVNPDHLSAGTHAQNMAEAAERGLMASGEDHPFFGKPGRLRGPRLRTSRQVFVLGLPFGSLNEAERHFALGSGTVAYWIKTGNAKAREISRDEYMTLTGKTNGIG